MAELLINSLGLDTPPELWDFGIIFILVFVEGALSADNAAVLAALTRTLPTRADRKRSLRYGIVGAFIFRFISVLCAAWLINNWALKLAGALYLVYLAVNHFAKGKSEHETTIEQTLPPFKNPLLRSTLGRLSPFWRVIILVELTDIAFSIDSITAAVAFSNKAWVVITGGILGIIAMRFIAEFFIELIEQFTRLENAAFLAVGFIGAKMLVEVGLELNGIYKHLPEWAIILVVACIFGWGFTKKRSLGAGATAQKISLRS